MQKLIAISALFSFTNFLYALQINVNFDFVNAFEEFRNDESAFKFCNVQLNSLNERQNGLCYEPKKDGEKTYCTFKFGENAKFGQKGTTTIVDISFDVVEKKSGKVKKNTHQLYYFSAQDKIVAFIDQMSVAFVTYIGPRGRNYYNYN